MKKEPSNSERDAETRNSVPSSSAELGTRLEEVVDTFETRVSAANVMEVSVDSLARYLRGSEPPFSAVARLCDAAGYRMEWVWSGSGSRKAGGVAEARAVYGPEPGEAEFVLVPRYNVTAESGAGAEVFEDEIVEKLAFRRRWLEEEGLLGEPLSVVSSSGDSMWPTIPPDAVVLVNNRYRSYVRPGIYVLLAFGRLVVKRLDMDPVGGDIHIISDNDRYPRRVVTPDLQSDLHIAGRAVWWAPGHADT